MHSVSVISPSIGKSSSVHFRSHYANGAPRGSHVRCIPSAIYSDSCPMAHSTGRTSAAHSTLIPPLPRLVQGCPPFSIFPFYLFLHFILLLTFHDVISGNVLSLVKGCLYMERYTYLLMVSRSRP